MRNRPAQECFAPRFVCFRGKEGEGSATGESGRSREAVGRDYHSVLSFVRDLLCHCAPYDSDRSAVGRSSCGGTLCGRHTSRLRKPGGPSKRERKGGEMTTRERGCQVTRAGLAPKGRSTCLKVPKTSKLPALDGRSRSLLVRVFALMPNVVHTTF